MPEPRDPLTGLARRGLADAPVAEVRERVLGAWDDFLALVESTDLERPSRLPGLSGADVLVHLGLWEDSQVVDDLVAGARAGAPTQPTAGGDASGPLLQAHRDAGADAVRAAVRRSRDRLVEFFDDGEAEEVGRIASSSTLGPMPVLALVGAGTYELAVHALDLEPCGAPAPSDHLLDAGLGALIDVTGCLCARSGLQERVTAQTPVGSWQLDSRGGDGWTTVRPAGSDKVDGARVRGSARHLLDISAGRVGLGPRVASRDVTVSGLPTFLRLAPLVDEVPGIPGGAALRRAARGLGSVGKIARGLGKLDPR